MTDLINENAGYDRDEMNIFGEELSRDHCQSGTAQKISVLSPRRIYFKWWYSEPY